MVEKIKILHVVGQMDRGGTETLLMNLLRILDRSRFQFDFVEQTQRRCDYDDEIEALGSQIYRCPTISIRNLKSYRTWWRSFFREHPEYKIVHGHSRGSAPIYLDEAKKAGCVTILHCHSNSYGKGLSGFLRFVWQIPLHWMADYNFACSKDAGISQFGKRAHFDVIKNGILSKCFSWSTETRASIRKEYGIENALVIGNVARFEKPKNHIFLLDIFKEIKTVRQDAKLLLVGKGSMEKEIRSKASCYGMLDDIIFAGVREDVQKVLQAMDVFVFPSLYEGLPLALLEAQSTGLPCFISDTVSQEAVITDVV